MASSRSKTNRALAALLLAAPAFALAAAPGNSISDEFGIAAGQTDPHNPRTGQVTDTLSASIDAGKGWSIDLSVGLTVVEATKGVAGRQYGSRGGSTSYFGPGVDWEASDHFTFGLALDYSPSSTLRTDTTIAYASTMGPANVDALLSVKTSTSGARLSASYDTAGDSDLETQVDLDVGVTHFDAEQHILATRDPSTGATVTDSQIRAYCLTHPCSKQLLGLLRDQATPLDQTELRLGITETISRDTDVGLGGSYFLYDRDPTDVGFFGLSAASGPHFGSGIPLAPVRWSVRPEVAHRFGDFGVRLWLEHGSYVDEEGTTNVLGVKLQYKLAKTFRMWLTGSWQRDRSAQNDITTFNHAALGGMWLF